MSNCDPNDASPGARLDHEEIRLLALQSGIDLLLLRINGRLQPKILNAIALALRDIVEDGLAFIEIEKIHAAILCTEVADTGVLPMLCQTAPLS